MTARTLVILTVPGIGKTWYKEHYENYISPDAEGRFPIVFDMKKYIKGQENDYPTRLGFETAFRNIIFICRKLGLWSIIMANYDDRLANICQIDHIPYYAVIPTRMYEYANKYGYDITSSVSKMRNTSVFKKLIVPTEHLSDNISKMWNDQSYHKQWETYKGR